MRYKIDTKLGITILMVLTIIIGGYLNFLFRYVSFPFSPPILFPTPFPELKGVEKFSSEEEFKAYLQEAELGYYGGFAMMEAARVGGIAQEAIPSPMVPLEAEVPERVSETTVQVAGIDEPDIVKTDGKEIYFSSGQGYYWRRFLEIMPPKIIGETKIIKAFPPADLAIDAKIDKRGDLLLHKNILVIFSGDKIYGYDISNPKSPVKKWTMDLEDNNYVVAARLYKDKIYLITRTRIDSHRPCPIRPLSVEGVPLEIRCVDIYHPVISVPVDVTYNAVVFEPASGKTEKSVSFVGTSNSSVVYVSQKAIYTTYSYYGNIIKFYSHFFKEKCQDIIPDWVIEKLEKLEGYDISDAAKFTEFTIILGKYYNSLSDDERLRVQNELANRMEDYYKEHKRELERTGIVKIGLDEFGVKANGDIPGKPLNQFSLDEYNNYLRVA
ncbi:MAG: beta-propeller domain-containing protein, partial [Candidatus Paceibacterales bacterium]